MSTDAHYAREVLVADERGRPVPAVIRFGPYLFVSGSDGYRDPADEQIKPELANEAVAQCRNAYGRVRQRLERAGYSGDCAVWIENFTSGQHWRLERMALWPEYFGEEGHGQAVSFGAQTRLNGINMLTASVLAVDPAHARHVIVKQPARGRASRITRVGDLIFVIGVRGHKNPETGEPSPEECPGAFEAQAANCIRALAAHLDKDGRGLDNFLRIDCALRGERFVAGAEAALRQPFDGRLPFALQAFGTILGGRTEQEIGGVAIADPAERRIQWDPADATRAESTSGAGLVFLRGMSGMRDEQDGRLLHRLVGDLKGQVRQVLENIDRALERAGTDRSRLLRFDVVLRDIYDEDAVIGHLAAELGGSMPVATVIGGEPRNGAELEVTAIAGGGA